MAHQENKELIEALASCIAACEHCADACLEEDHLSELIECIRLDRDCADVCQVTLAFVARDSADTPTMVDLCADFCSDCAEECEKHDHDHCQECAEACRECEEACRDY